MTLKSSAFAIAALMALAAPASADFAKVNDRDTFLELVGGKRLVRPLVDVTVSPNGKIVGKGAAWAVSGDWTWKQGYFCRSLFWGGDDLGYNCQKVEVNDARVRFTSDKGAGQSADFRLK